MRSPGEMLLSTLAPQVRHRQNALRYRGNRDAAVSPLTVGPRRNSTAAFRDHAADGPPTGPPQEGARGDVTGVPPMSAILLPEQLTSQQTTLLSRAANALATEAESDLLDASGVKTFGPLSMVALALAAARRKRAGLSAVDLRRPQDEQAAAYLDEVGFSRLLAGEDPSRRGADTLEIRQMTTHDRMYTERIADVLVGNVEGYDENASHLIHLCLNELLQNVFEWAHSPEGAMVHCRWYRKMANVRIAVADSGVGIPEALRQRFAHQSDAEVIAAAVTREGLSSSPHSSRGLGLKLIKDIVTSRNGTLTVISHTGLVVFGPGATVRKRRCEAVVGTAIEIDFRPHVDVRSPEAML